MLVLGLKLWFVEVFAGGVVPDVEAPDGSGVFHLVAAFWLVGHVPDVDGVSDECGELEEDELLELVSGGGSGAGGATGAGGAWAGAEVGAAFRVSPNGYSLVMDVQLYWNSGMVSGSPVRNL